MNEKKETKKSMQTKLQVDNPVDIDSEEPVASGCALNILKNIGYIPYELDDSKPKIYYTVNILDKKKKNVMTISLDGHPKGKIDCVRNSGDLDHVAWKAVRNLWDGLYDKYKDKGEYVNIMYQAYEPGKKYLHNPKEDTTDYVYFFKYPYSIKTRKCEHYNEPCELLSR